MNEIDYIAFNLTSNLVSSKLASLLIDNKRFDNDYFQMEILNSTLIFNKVGLIENTHVFFNDNNDNKKYIEFVVLDKNPLSELEKVNNEFGNDTSYFILFIKENLNSTDLEKIEKNINRKFETKFNSKSFNFINGRFCMLFYSQCESNIPISIKSNKRKKVSLPRGTYLKTLKDIKNWLGNYGEVSFLELMEKFESEVKKELLNLKDSSIDIEDELKTFRQVYGTGAKRSQILLHTVNEKNRVHFRSNISSEYDTFYYVDNHDIDTNINNRIISAFNPQDNKQKEIEVYYEKGKKPIKVRDFKDRYLM